MTRRTFARSTWLGVILAGVALCGCRGQTLPGEDGHPGAPSADDPWAGSRAPQHRHRPPLHG